MRGSSGDRIPRAPKLKVSEAGFPVGCVEMASGDLFMPGLTRN